MARVCRVKAPGNAFYHIISRVTHREYLLEDAVKAKLRQLLYAVAEFSGITIGDYVFLDNHFHLLAYVPTTGDRPLAEDEVIRRVGFLYSNEVVKDIRKRLSDFHAAGRAADAEALLDRYRHRMNDLSEFVKTFKQRVTQWYNREYEKSGTLWEGRFKSVLVEESSYLAHCAGYIRGNPLRAGKSKRADGSDYVWCATGAAAHGDAWARKGLDFIRTTLTQSNVTEDHLPVYNTSDKRFENGIIGGSLAFVKQMTARLLPNRKHPHRPEQLVCGLYTSHGQHSVPKAA